VLSERDLEGMATVVDDSHREPALEGLALVGWYHSNTRSDIGSVANAVELIWYGIS